MSLSILIVDDEHWVRENLRVQLESLEGGHRILEPAVDGEHAITRVDADHPDLIITDIDMPFLSGNALIKALRPRHPDLPIVVLSGYSDFSFVREALLDGALDYLLKPVTPDHLRRIVDKAEKHLSDRRSQHESDARSDEQLKRAESLLRDEALSALLQADSEPADTLSLGLEMSEYAVLLVNVLDHTSLAWNALQDLRDRAAKVKTLLARELSGSGRWGVFQNLLTRNEYVILCDGADLRALATRLAAHLARYLGSRVEVGLSARFYSMSKVAEAYRQAQWALESRPWDSAPLVQEYVSEPEGKLPTRVTNEHEMLLGLAVAAGDAAQLRDIVFERVGLRSAGSWRMAEIRQTVRYLVGLIGHRTKLAPSSRTGLVQEALLGQLDHGLKCRSLDEVCTVLEQWIDELFGGSNVATSLSMRQTVRQVKDHIQEHYFENLSLATLSASFHVDSSYLSKVYKQVTGTNLMAAIARCRIDKAKEYIRDRDLSLTEVASLVGYEEYAYFNRVFRKIEGVSPSEYKSAQGRALAQH